MLSHEKINKIYKSRKNILEIVKRLGYNTTDYENFSEQEIDILLSTNQLDMVLYKKKSQ
jgi:glucan phosphoethanolaminetransferase (alkaline phosphatase superfamily)